MEKEAIYQLNRQIMEVVSLIEGGEFDAAKEFFVRELLPAYSTLQTSTGPVRLLLSYYFDLHDFLLKDSWRVSGATSKKMILDSFHSDYQDALKEVLKEEDILRPPLS